MSVRRPRRVALDLAVILLLVSAVVGIRAAAPSTTYTYAQFLQIRASIDQVNGGSWLLPTIDPNVYEPAHKPQLYAWMLSSAMLLTDAKDLPPQQMEFIFRIPTILAAAGLVVVIYLLGGRWYSRRVGLVSACLWVTLMHMNKLMYNATTDMLLSFWIGFCVLCMDRLLFHPVRRGRWAWATAFWLGMIAASLTKGWGVVNLAILGGVAAFAGGVAPGLAATAKVASPAGRLWIAIRLLWRRWWSVMRRVKLGWGLAAMAVLFVPLWWGMFHVGGEQFREIVRFELVQRITGEGEYAPSATSGPPLMHLYYYTLPASIFAGCALFLAPPLFRRRLGAWGAVRWILTGWFHRKSPIALPMWWIFTVVLAFSVPAGFRPDYLAPCYPAVALLAGWSVHRLSRAAVYHARGAKHLRRIAQATPLVLAGAMIVISPLYLFGWNDTLGWLPEPAFFGDVVWYGLAVLPPVMIVVLILAGLSFVRKSIVPAAFASCIAMLGMVFLYANLWSRQARTGDGEVMVRFAQQAKPIVADASFLTYQVSKLGPEVYLGRFGRDASYLQGGAVEGLNRTDTSYLFVSDRGLLQLGAYQAGDEFRIKIDGEKRYFTPRPQDLGRVVQRSDRQIEMEDWGRIYLIELRRPIRPSSPPLQVGYITDEAL